MPDTLGPAEGMYTLPPKDGPHASTWLQWPHQHQYGMLYRDDLDPTWVELTRQLVASEEVDIIVYDATEADRVTGLLNDASVDMARVRLHEMRTDDFWVRDNGPVFALDSTGRLVVVDFGFNGWGGKADFAQCDAIPQRIAQLQGRPRVDLNDVLINEGGSIELDGHGALMACKSSILNANRNPGMTQDEVERIFTTYLGATHFIWLDGQPGIDITDQHIDGFARFAAPNTIVTMSPADLMAYDVLPSDVDKLYAARNGDGVPYDFVTLPLTQNDVVTTYGLDLGYPGSYCNYYVANTVVLVPTYADPNDAVALDILRTVYPGRTVVGIDFRNAYAEGGMTHCVTMQEPVEP